MTEENATTQYNDTAEFHTSKIMLEAGQAILATGQIQALLLYVDGLEDPSVLDSIDFESLNRVILVARDKKMQKLAHKYSKDVVNLPEISLTRMGQIKLSVMLSFSKRLLEPGDRFVFITGLTSGELDTLMILEVGREYEIFQSVDQPPITEHIRRAVFERVFSLALQLAMEGREGKPIGSIFVLGDTSKVTENSRQMVLNPFKGYPEEQCNILDDQMVETVKEFSAIDGAFIVKGTGTIVSAGTYLLPGVIGEELPRGLGARHAAAAAITTVTHSIAVTISESTGTVRVWRQGKMITEIERAANRG